MKIKSLLETLSGGLAKSFTLGAVLLLFIPAPATRAASAADLLEKGIYTEETKGELRAAAELYQQIVDDPKASRSLVAQAHPTRALPTQAGQQATGHIRAGAADARFPDKDKLLAVVEQHMPQLLDEMLTQIEQNYIEEIDRSELMETACAPLPAS
jgi:hypothetical protein